MDATPGERLSLSELNREIALSRYEVDAGAVAGEILAKLRLVRRGRAALTEAGRIPPPTPPHPQAR